MNQAKNEEQREHSDGDGDVYCDGNNDGAADTNTPVIPPQIPLYVPPMQAAVQQSYIPAHNPLENIPTERTRCAWYPKCKKNRIICKGLNRKNCIHFKHRDGDEDFVNEMLSEKKELKKQRDREMKRIKRRRLRTNI